QGKIVASWTRIPFTILYFTIIILGVLTGLPLMKKIWTRDFWKINSLKALHSFSASFMFLFYVNSAFTGMIYRNLREIFNVKDDYISWLIKIHAADYSRWTQIIYINFMATFTFLFLLTGVLNYVMFVIHIIRQWRDKNVEVVDEEYGQIEEDG